MNLMFGLPETTGLDRAAGRSLGRVRVAAAVWWRVCASISASPRRRCRCARTCLVLALAGRWRGAVRGHRRPWWWGFDVGRLFAGFDRSEVEQELATLRDRSREAARRSGSAARAGQRGRQQARRSSGVAAEARAADQELQNENARLQARSSPFCRSCRRREAGRGFRSCASKWSPTAARGSATACCCCPAAPREREFQGPWTGGDVSRTETGAVRVLTLPDEQPATAAPLGIQALPADRGHFSRPAGQVGSVQARVYETAHSRSDAERDAELDTIQGGGRHVRQEKASRRTASTA